MKTRWIVLIAVLAVVTLSSSRCMNFTGITGSKNYITRDFKIGDFDKINASTVANIEYTQSTNGSTSLQIYGSDNIVELVKVDLKDNTLFISMKKKNIRNGNLKINISSPNLYEVKSHGVGNLYIKEKLETTSLKINNDGVGDIKINDVTCTDISIYNSGVGDASIQGKAENVTLVTQGVGNVNASGLIGQNVKAKSEGVGNVSCYATVSIEARVNGVGNVSYKGNPEKKDLKKNGVGSIKHKD